MRAHEIGPLPGHGSATGEIVDRHWESLYRFAFLLCGRAEEAEDLVQEAFARLLAVETRPASIRSPVSYLRRSVTNLFLERRRRVNLWNRRLPVLLSQTQMHDPADHAGLRDEVQRGLRRLGDRERAAIVLRYYLDLNYDEIGHFLECPATTARSLAARGLARMRVSLDADDEEVTDAHHG